jgi:cobalt-zinc-cadmium efflux system protein
MTASGKHKGAMVLVLVITSCIFIAELIGAYISHSLVLLADAGHMFADAGGIALALFAIYVASRPPTTTRTFGYQRMEILAATMNALILLGLSAFVIIQGVMRFFAPPEVEPNIMIIFGIVAIIGNAISLFLLRKGQAESLNVKGAFLEVLSDMLGAGAVIVAAVVIMLTGWHQADAVASILIGILIIPRTVKLLLNTFDVLLEAVPRNINITDVRKHILEVEGVSDAHDLHVWLITSGVPVLSAHVVVSNTNYPVMLDKLQECLRDHFDVEHSTFQLEPAQHASHEHELHK